MNNPLRAYAPIYFDVSSIRKQMKQNAEPVAGVCVVFLKNSKNSQENTCVGVSVFFEIFIKKKATEQVFFCEFCKIFKNTFFTENLRWLFRILEKLKWIRTVAQNELKCWSTT